MTAGICKNSVSSQIIWWGQQELNLHSYKARVLQTPSLTTWQVYPHCCEGNNKVPLSISFYSGRDGTDRTPTPLFRRQLHFRYATPLLNEGDGNRTHVKPI